MTDYTKLIEGLRKEAEFDHNHETLSMLLCAADAIEALQTECAEHKENAMRNARIAVSIRAERDQLQAENDLLKGYRDRALELATAYNNAQENIEQINAHREHILAVNEKLTAQVDAMGKGEPVGFVAPHDLKTLREGYPATVVMLPSNKRTEPLYAAPKALAPLTDAQRLAIFEEVKWEGEDGWEYYYGDVINAVERAHGIGGTP